MKRLIFNFKRYLSKKLRSQNGVVTYEDIKYLTENTYFLRLLTSQFYKFICKTVLICFITLVHTAYTSLLAYLLVSNIFMYINNRQDQRIQISVQLKPTQANCLHYDIHEQSNTTTSMSNNYGIQEINNEFFEKFEYLNWNLKKNQKRTRNHTDSPIHNFAIKPILMNRLFGMESKDAKLTVEEIL